MLRVLARTLFMFAIPSSLLFSCGSSREGGESTGGVGGTSPGGTGGGSAGTAGSRAGTGGASAGTTSGGSSSAGAQTGGANTSGGGGAQATGGTQAGGTGGGGSAGTGAGTAGTGGAGPIECGAQICSASQYCVIPCCGGAPPQCTPKPSGGTCPAGTHAGCAVNISQCPDPVNCCQQDACTPPPRFCSDEMPVGCAIVVGRSCMMGCA